MLKLSLYQEEVFKNYKSNSQIARVLSEDWFSSEMYCPCCLNEKIDKHPNNQKATDFFCESCNNEFQSKGSSSEFKKRILDGEYNTMMKFINSNLSPNFFLMHYSVVTWKVKDLFFVPNFFITNSIIEKRKPLSENARRAGWTGCNILLERIPREGRIPIIFDEKVEDKNKVNKTWKKMKFMNKKSPDFRGWTSDILKCVQSISKKEFNLSDIYSFKDYLKKLYPDNNNIEAKIRQQLQILRDNGILRFDNKGNYTYL
jgi:type II restriction enzyme